MTLPDRAYLANRITLRHVEKSNAHYYGRLGTW
jgi:hypothetical protein